MKRVQLRVYAVLGAIALATAFGMAEFRQELLTILAALIP